MGEAHRKRCEEGIDGGENPWGQLSVVISSVRRISREGSGPLDRMERMSAEAAGILYRFQRYSARQLLTCGTQRHIHQKPRLPRHRSTRVAYRLLPRAGRRFFQCLQMVIRNWLPVGPVQHAGDGEADVHGPRLRAAFQTDNQTEAGMDFSSFPSVKVGGIGASRYPLS